jgi:predicted DNA-binding WGR domain protein
MIRNFIFEKGHGGKVWSIEVTGPGFMTTWGKAYGELTNTLKKFPDEAKCQKEADKVIASKLKEGYREVTLQAKGVPVPTLRKVEQAKAKKAKELSVCVSRSAELVQVICTITSLEDLTLNDTSVVPPEIANLKALKRLEVEESEALLTLPAEIGKLTRLESLSIKDTSAKALPAEIGNLTRLRRLYIWSNRKLVEVPRTIGKLVNLETLWIQYNRENEDKGALRIPDLGALKKVTDLSLSSNGLTDLPTGIGKLKELEDLDLNFNKLVDLPQELFKLERLQSLSLDYNKLKRLAPELCKLKRLEDIALEGCPIKNVPRDVFITEDVQAILAFLAANKTKA